MLLKSEKFMIFKTFQNQKFKKVKIIKDIQLDSNVLVI
jgi:hypothetical protein